MPVALAFLRSPPIEVYDEMTIVQVTDRGKERATMTPSLIVKLSLPRFVPHEPLELPPCREVQTPHIKTEKKRGFGSTMDNEQGLGEFTPLLDAEPIRKRQRLSARIPQSTQEAKGPPKPRGQPEVWAEVAHV